MRTSCAMYQWLREVTAVRDANGLGGQGQIVQIDESLCRRKPKVYTPQKCQLKGHTYNYTW